MGCDFSGSRATAKSFCRCLVAMLLGTTTFQRIGVVVEVNENCNQNPHNVDCELRSSVVVRDRRTDPKGAPEHFVIPQRLRTREPLHTALECFRPSAKCTAAVASWSTFHRALYRLLGQESSAVRSCNEEDRINSAFVSRSTSHQPPPRTEESSEYSAEIADSPRT